MDKLCIFDESHKIIKEDYSDFLDDISIKNDICKHSLVITDDNKIKEKIIRELLKLYSVDEKMIVFSDLKGINFLKDYDKKIIKNINLTTIEKTITSLKSFEGIILINNCYELLSEEMRYKGLIHSLYKMAIKFNVPIINVIDSENKLGEQVLYEVFFNTNHNLVFKIKG